MMKVSDPIIFGHAVRAYFPVVFADHEDALRRAGVNANDGLGALRAGDRHAPEASAPRSPTRSTAPTDRPGAGDGRLRPRDHEPARALAT